MDVSKLKKIAQKHNKCTINDVVLGMASVALKKYMINHGDPNQPTCNMFIPFSFRPIPKTPKDLQVCNDFSGLNFTIDLNEDFREATSKVQVKTRKLKNSLYPHGVRAL